MVEKEFACPHCRRPAPLTEFRNMGSGMLRCRSCRSDFPDPNAYRREISYADCDSLKPVTRFPYSLSGKNVRIHVPQDYMALLVSNTGGRLWLEAEDNVVDDQPEGFQLFYVCLKPQVQWGTRSLKEFGAYGTAKLSVSREYIRRFCGPDGSLSGLDHRLKSLVDMHITSCVQKEIEHGNIAYLEHRSGYSGMPGFLTEGVHLISIDPKGFRNADGIGTFPRLQSGSRAEDSLSSPLPPKTRIELLQPSRKQYTVRNGTEELFIRKDMRTQRHKAGEIIDPKSLADVARVLRFHVKEFSLPYGWGLFNLTGTLSGYFSSYGTVSFYIDSTELLSQLLRKTHSWEEFEEHFFDDVFRKELSYALKDVVGQYTGTRHIAPEGITGQLSAMSLELTALLNGEDASGRTPAFRQYGLRVDRIDILQIDFYTVRR